MSLWGQGDHRICLVNILFSIYSSLRWPKSKLAIGHWLQFPQREDWLNSQRLLFLRNLNHNLSLFLTEETSIGHSHNCESLLLTRYCLEHTVPVILGKSTKISPASRCLAFNCIKTEDSCHVLPTRSLSQSNSLEDIGSFEIHPWLPGVLSIPWTFCLGRRYWKVSVDLFSFKFLRENSWALGKTDSASSL